MKTEARRHVHIAVLDADPELLKYVHGILADRFTVSLFTEAAELTRSLKNCPVPNLLLMDWNVAKDDTEETALSLLARLHAWKPSLQIVMFACSAELKEVVMAARMGASNVILKPFSKADLDQAVEQCLREP